MSKDNIEPMTWAQIDLSALKSNFKQIRNLAGANQFNLPSRRGSKKRLTNPEHILTVIKADAYGHGMKEIAQLLDNLHVGYFGVSNIQEGIELRKLNIKKPILIFENTLSENASAIVNHDLIPTVFTHELAHALNQKAKLSNKRIKIHIKVDTGMGRLGIWHKDAYKFIEEVNRFRNLIIHGIYTHFPCADTDKAFTRKQISQLHDLVTKLDQSGIIIPYIHASNSMGLAGYKTQILNLFRPGLMLYGASPVEGLKRKVDLKPVMSVRSRIIYIKEIGKGRSVSYGRTFIAKKNMIVATIPIGYKDGYFRNLSNKADVLVGGKRCPVLGRVTMDQIIVDVTNVKPVRLGMPVTVLGKQKNEMISADEIAKHAKTISYEVFCSLGNNIPRSYK